ncbi:NmrA family NAD(P)-binding protein [Archangium violaceum]|uniref:NmrA family NAD(P)-binding protein n=1 Tax=Archangium violaceum TaxID=83451 RepID=UPI00194FDE31|nr:NmrA family NAD(P)-binding protein [Archangium violaceum]QRN96648.1 NmrA family NAD(P)-binding protein [Archangium violaceum]
MTDAVKKTVLLVGASGALGGMIARALLEKPGVIPRCLVRPGSRAKLADLEAAGVRLVEGDLGADSEAALAAACSGVWSVVSAVQGGPDVIIDGQLRLLRAAIAARARRFIPSDYALDYFNLAEGENISTDWRRQFARAADEQTAGTGLEVVHVLNGCFLDRRVLFGFLGMIDLDKGTARYWGDGDRPMDFTTYADTARYTAEAAVDPEPLPSRFNVAGETLDFHQLVRAYQEASGRTLKLERLGSLEELDKELARRWQAEPGNMSSWLPLMFSRAMLNGKGRLGKLVNARYPHIHPATVREYVRREKL